MPCWLPSNRPSPGRTNSPSPLRCTTDDQRDRRLWNRVFVHVCIRARRGSTMWMVVIECKYVAWRSIIGSRDYCTVQWDSHTWSNVISRCLTATPIIFNLAGCVFISTRNGKIKSYFSFSICEPFTAQISKLHFLKKLCFKCRGA